MDTAMILSSRGLKNIVCDDSTFVFKVNGQEFEISKFKAQFLSPAVSRSLCFDSTQSSFTIEVPNAIDCFETILSLSEGNAISVEKSRVFEFGEVCRALGNDELIHLAMGDDPVSTSNVGLRLSLLITDRDVGFAGDYFVCLDHSSLPVTILEVLLSDKRLKISSEDWLLNVVKDRVSRDGSLIGLLDYIQCEYLSAEAMSQFLSLISIESMSSSLWSSLCRRLRLPISISNADPRFLASAIPFDRTRPFDGVFAYLSRKYGQNPAIAGVIAISANDERPVCKFPRHEILSDSRKKGTWWGTNNAAVDHYLQIDFKNLRLTPSGYSVKVHNTSWAPAGHFIRSWRFEGSNDDSKWEVLDSHTDSDLLMGNDKEASFAVSTGAEFRFLRFVQTGANSSGYYSFSLQRLETFGILTSPCQCGT
jgi:hypothetical protein